LNKQIPEDIKPDYICKDLNEVRTLLLSESEEGSIVV